MLSAARHGNLPRVRELYDAGQPIGAATFRMAALSGNIELLDWLLEQSCPWDVTVAHAAWRQRDPWIRTWVDRHLGVSLHARACMVHAAAGGHLRWLQAAGDVPMRDAMEMAMSFGQVHVVAWLHLRGYQFRIIHSRVLQRGHTAILKYLHKCGERMHPDYIRSALDCGQLETAKWLLSVTPEFDWTGAGKYAVKSGKVHIAQWAHDQGAHFDEGDRELLMAAADAGQHMLAWLHSIGLNISGAAECAAALGKYDVLQWMQRNGHINYSELVGYIIVHGDIRALKWVQPYYRFQVEDCTEASRQGYLHMLRWMHSHGARWSAQRTLMTALYQREPAVATWVQPRARLHVRMYLEARSMGRRDVMQWLLRHATPRLRRLWRQKLKGR